jgi:SynChlorMet cassette radical SAM/SPASM protein ScmF
MNIQADKKQPYPLHAIYFYPTESCNLKCIHCWVQPTHAVSKKAYDVQNKDNVSVETMEQVAQDAISLGLRHLKFTGGEPFLNPSIFEYLERLSCYGLSFSFETNGTLLTRRMVQRLGHYNLKQISTSLDGSVPEVHDKIRRVKGSFKKALKGIELLIEHRIYPQIIFCLQKLNAHDLENTIRLAHRLRVKSFEINPLALNGDRPDSIGCESLPVEDLIELEQKVENELAERYAGMHIDLYLPPALKGTQELSRQALCTCNIFNICGILSNGDVSICGIGRTNKDMVMGNVKQDSIARIWQEGILFKEIRERVPFELKGICGKCLFKYQCLGFCRADVLGHKQSLVDSYPICEEVFQKGLFPQTRILSKREIKNI